MKAEKCTMCSQELIDHLLCGCFFLLFKYRYNISALVEGHQPVIENKKEDH